MKNKQTTIIIISYLRYGASRSGKVFNYEKTRMVDLKYLLINKIRWNKTESILFVEDIWGMKPHEAATSIVLREKRWTVTLHELARLT